ncbi:MAG: type II secretion system major pseudopilin GspG [Sphingomonadales bacterium]|nr:type II secretion system major pseudopilin GspG [Sphingomonadales bacterium]
MPDEKYRRKTKRQAKPAPNGFTLVEMLVTVFILGLLTTIVVLAVLPNQDKAMVSKAKADIATLSQAMEIYRLDNASYPDAGQGLQALTAAPAGGGAGGAYIKKLPNDPWGRPYQYSNPGRNGGFDIYSLGADGAPGGENENADIYSD